MRQPAQREANGAWNWTPNQNYLAHLGIPGPGRDSTMALFIGDARSREDAIAKAAVKPPGYFKALVWVHPDYQAREWRCVVYGLLVDPATLQWMPGRGVDTAILAQPATANRFDPVPMVSSPAAYGAGGSLGGAPYPGQPNSMWQPAQYTPQTQHSQFGNVASGQTSAGASSSPAAAPSPKFGRANRAMSYLSQEALNGLCGTSIELNGLEARVDDIVAKVQRGELTPGQGRTELSQVEAAGHKVECDKVDSIYTSELQTGKDEAKAEKKTQIKRLEQLFENLEVHFKWIKTLEP